MATQYGRCRRCKGDKDVNTLRLCPACLLVAGTRVRRYTRCAGCEQTKPEDSQRFCAVCRETPEYRAQQAEYQRQYRARQKANPDQMEARNERRRARYARGKANREEIILRHREITRAYGQRPEVRAARKARWSEQRALVFQHYGAMCVCCKDTDLERLTIDHTFGNGAEHRRQDPTARAIYHWLVKKKFPRGFRVLCGACHHSLSHYGFCRHNPDLRVEPLDPDVVAEWAHA